MTLQAPRGRWVRRHPVLAVLWLILAGCWLAAIIAVYEDDPGVSLFAYLIPMIPVTAIVFGLGVLSDRFQSRRHDGASVSLLSPGRSSGQEHAVMPDVALLQRKLDDETRRQQDLALQLRQREAELGRREADLQVREALLRSTPQPQPVSLTESKPSFDPVATQPDRRPDQVGLAKFCFNCGAWFARDDQTCRLCGARRVGAET